MSKLRNPNLPPVTWTSGQLGSSMTAPALAASAPLRKVGPRFTVTEANLSIQSVINPEKNGKETPIWGGLLSLEK